MYIIVDLANQSVLTQPIRVLVHTHTLIYMCLTLHRLGKQKFIRQLATIYRVLLYYMLSYIVYTVI